MIRNASRIWGYTDVQDINSFDPLVRMLVDTLADELYNLQSKLTASEERIAEKLLDILFNRSGLSHSPAHALVQAVPQRSRVKINGEYQMAVQTQVPKKVGEETKYEIRELVFTPTSEVTLARCEVACMELGGRLFKTSGQDKEAVGRTNRSMAFDRTRICLGLSLPQEQTDLSGLLLYFLVKNNPEEDRLYSLLSTGSWRINDNPVVVHNGIEQENGDQHEGLSSLLLRENSKTYSSCQAINTIYDKAFFRIAGATGILQGGGQPAYIPVHIRQGYDDKALKHAAKVNVWIEVYLEGAIPEELIEDFIVLVNCFPVINRRLHEVNYSISKGLNILPLATEDIFFDMKELTDSTGAPFKALESLDNNQFNQEAYYISQQGVARYNSRESQEMINQLISLVRNEGAAFSAIGRDLILSELHELTQLLNRLQQRIEANSTPNDPSAFVFLTTNRKTERAHMSYWSTTGELANNIRAGSFFTVIRGIDLEPQVLLLTNTTGGKRKLSQEEKLNKLRVSLLSHGRITTNEDIKAFCFDYFGSELKSVRISKGIRLDENPRAGMVRCINVHLLFQDHQTITSGEIATRIRNISSILEKKTQLMIPIRIFAE